MRLKIGVIAAAAAAVIAAGCGGSAGGNEPVASGAASIAPASAVAYVAQDTNLDSAAWTKAKALLDRFPGKDKIIKELRSSLENEGLDYETDIKPALGDEVDVVWLDLANDGDNVVGLTKPKDPAKLDALLSKGSTPLVHEQVDGWTAFAETQALLDRFDRERDDSGSLSDDSAFSSFADLESDSIERAWLRGGAAQTELDRRLHAAGLPADITKNTVGALDAVTAAVTPGSDGVKVAASLAGDLKVAGSSYQAELPGAVPAGAIAYVSFNGLGDTLKTFVDTYGGSIQNFDQQRAQIELVLGYSLEDVYGLLDGEGGIAVYPAKGAGTPGVVFVAGVSDESKAQNILNRLATLAASTGNLDIKTVQIGSVQAKELTLQNGISAFAAVSDGKLVITNSRKRLEETLGSGPKLSDDAAYTAAVAEAGVPEETTGFVYADVQEALEYAFDYVESHGETVPQIVTDNTAPLRALLLYGSKDGGNLTLTGFLGIQ